MATISSFKTNRPVRFFARSSQLRYAAAYILIAFFVLLFLNIYAPLTLRSITFAAQKTAMTDKAQLLVSAFASSESLDAESVGETIRSVHDLHATRLMVTDPGGRCLYDSAEGRATLGRLVLYPEIVEALEGNDAVYIRLDGEKLVSKAAMPIMAYNRLLGAVYLLERDDDQAALISGLQKNLLLISVLLEAAIALFSLFFASLFSRRVKILHESVRRMHDGDYSVRLPEKGSDEISGLGAAFNELAARLSHSEEVRKQFVSDASHELKTPLASIKLLADSILQNDMDKDTMREFVSDIGSEADRLTRLSARLLELTRLDNQTEAERTLLEVDLVAERVIRMLRPLAAEQAVTLTQDCAPGCLLLGSEDDLYQILFNLVENAIKYNHPDGSVFLSATHSDKTVTIRVEDTGFGIPDEAKARVFERFYRVDKARSRKAGGVGLGLSIVHDMVSRSRGTVRIEDRPGGGTVFVLEFPLFEAEEVAE